MDDRDRDWIDDGGWMDDVGMWSVPCHLLVVWTMLLICALLSSHGDGLSAQRERERDRQKKKRERQTVREGENKEDNTHPSPGALPRFFTCCPSPLYEKNLLSAAQNDFSEVFICHT